MKKVPFILLLVIVILLAWFYLNKRPVQKPAVSESANAAVAHPLSQTGTNWVPAISNAFSSQPTATQMIADGSIASLTNALTATKIEQWKQAIKELRKSSGLSESWDMEQTNLTASIPITLQKNGQAVVYKAQFIDISIKNGEGDILEAQLHSPIMNIDDTRELGLQLCSMLGYTPKDFLAWCNKVGNNWLDAPLYSIGDHYYGFQILHSFNNEKPWYINFLIMHP